MQPCADGSGKALKGFVEEGRSSTEGKWGGLEAAPAAEASPRLGNEVSELLEGP